MGSSERSATRRRTRSSADAAASATSTGSGSGVTCGAASLRDSSSGSGADSQGLARKLGRRSGSKGRWKRPSKRTEVWSGTPSANAAPTAWSSPASDGPPASRVRIGPVERLAGQVAEGAAGADLDPEIRETGGRGERLGEAHGRGHLADEQLAEVGAGREQRARDRGGHRQPRRVQADPRQVAVQGRPRRLDERRVEGVRDAQARHRVAEARGRAGSPAPPSPVSPEITVRRRVVGGDATRR